MAQGQVGLQQWFSKWIPGTPLGGSKLTLSELRGDLEMLKFENHWFTVFTLARGAQHKKTFEFSLSVSFPCVSFFMAYIKIDVFKLMFF